MKIYPKLKGGEFEDDSQGLLFKIGNYDEELTVMGTDS